MLIKFCQHNFEKHTKSVVDRLKQDGLNVEVVGCINCHYCSGPFALMGENIVQADTADALYEKIKSA